MRSARIGWLLWLAVAFGLYGSGLPRQTFRTVERRFRAGEWPGVVDAARAYVTNDGDVRRYFAYAQAALGRPYQSYFVRTAEAWRRAFETAEPYRPDESPTVTPAHPLVAYRDFLVEYPPGFFLVSIPPAWLAHDADAYVKLFEVLMALCLTAGLLLTAETSRRILAPVAPSRVLAWAALAALLLGVVATHRFDAAVALAIVVAVWALATQRPLVLGVAIGIAIAVKMTPALMLPIVAMHAARERRLRDLGTTLFAAAAAIVVISFPSAAAAGRHLLETLRYHADRPAQIESTWGAALGLVHAFAPGAVLVEKTFGSTNVAGRFSQIATRLASLATLSGLLAVYVVTWRRLAAPSTSARARAALEGTAAALAVFIAAGKICSPQYLVWILPLGLVLSLADGRRACLALFLVLLAVTQLIYPVLYARLESLQPGVCALVLLRNAMLVGWAAMLLSRPMEPPVRD